MTLLLLVIIAVVVYFLLHARGLRKHSLEHKDEILDRIFDGSATVSYRIDDTSLPRSVVWEEATSRGYLYKDTAVFEFYEVLIFKRVLWED